MALKMINVRFRSSSTGKIVRSLYSRDGQHWFEDQDYSIPIDPKSARVAGSMDDVLFFVLLVGGLAYTVYRLFKKAPL